MVANGFYKNVRRLDAKDIEFVCYGMPRSGSTLVYQLISGIYSQGVVKTHRYCDHPVKTVVSYRDFRDTAVSLWRRSDPANLHKSMTEAEVDLFARRCQEHLVVLDRYFERGGVCPLQYEQFVNHPEIVFSAIESVFGVVVHPDTIAKLIKQHCLEENRRIAQRFPVFSRYDERTQIHGNHIYRGEVGSWREFVDNRGAERLERILRACLVRYGYRT